MDPVKSAEVSGLRYVTDALPGIFRRRSGAGFRYVTAEGKVVKDPEVLRRIRSLVIPPAWTDVWICDCPEGHIQAAGRDARGRKQYRYHALYRKVRNETKFYRMLDFAKVLPALRERVEKDISTPGLTKTKVVATVVKLLESTCIRVGNEEYVQQNESFGLTTLQDHHVKIGNETLQFHFKGKSGQIHQLTIRDKRLAKIVHQCQALPGQDLFQYLDDAGVPCHIRSEDVNNYIREATGGDFTAKDFRTWLGTTGAVVALAGIGPAKSQTEAKRNIVQAVKTVAEKLGNKPSTCKAYYIHAAVLDAYADGSFFDALKRCESRGDDPLGLEERCAVSLIQQAAKKGLSLIAE